MSGYTAAAQRAAAHSQPAGQIRHAPKGIFDLVPQFPTPRGTALSPMIRLTGQNGLNRIYSYYSIPLQQLAP
jgi:hypothetical protein